MADQKIVIDVRADTKAAQADLRALKASAADTARQLAAVGKQVIKKQLQVLAAVTALYNLFVFCRIRKERKTKQKVCTAFFS